MRISVDIGFGFTKAVSEKGKEVSFPSVVARRIASMTGGALGFGQDDYLVTIDGQEFYVGDAGMVAAGSRTWEDQVVQNENLKILVTTAIHVLLEDDEKVDLAVGLPMSFFLSQRKSIRDALMQLKADVSIGGKEKHIEIGSVFVFPQSAGVYYHALHNIDGSIKNQYLFNRQVGVIDPGYRTVDILYMARGRKGLLPREDLSGSEELGMNEAHKIVRIRTSQLVGGEADLLEVEKAILWYNFEFDYKGKTYNIRGICEQTYREHAGKIVAWVKQRWSDEINNLHAIILGGGGGEALYPYMKDSLPSLVKVDKPEFANAYGFLAAQALAMRVSDEVAAAKE